MSMDSEKEGCVQSDPQILGMSHYDEWNYHLLRGKNEGVEVRDEF